MEKAKIKHSILPLLYIGDTLDFCSGPEEEFFKYFHNTTPDKLHRLFSQLGYKGNFSYTKMTAWRNAVCQ
jgi:hypothetical protein